MSEVDSAIIDNVSTPGIRWLRGSTYVNARTGQLENSLSPIQRLERDKTKNPLNPMLMVGSFRQGIILHDQEHLNIEDIRKALTALIGDNQALHDYRTRAFSSITQIEDTIKSNTEMVGRAQRRSIERHAEPALDAAKKFFYSDTRLSSELRNVVNKISAESLQSSQSLFKKHQLTSAEYASAQNVLEGYLRENPDVYAILTQANWPIHIIRDLPGVTGTKRLISADVSYGIVIDERFIEVLRQPDHPQHEVFSMYLHNTLCNMAYSVIGVSKKSFGITDDQQWNRIITSWARSQEAGKPIKFENFEFDQPRFPDTELNRAVHRMAKGESVNLDELRSRFPDAVQYMELGFKRLHAAAEKIRASAPPEGLELPRRTSNGGATTSPAPSSLPETSLVSSGIQYHRGDEMTLELVAKKGERKSPENAISSLILNNTPGLKEAFRARPEIARQKEMGPPYNLAPVMWSASDLLTPEGRARLKTAFAFQQVGSAMQERFARSEKAMDEHLQLIRDVPHLFGEEGRPQWQVAKQTYAQIKQRMSVARVDAKLYAQSAQRILAMAEKGIPLSEDKLKGFLLTQEAFKKGKAAFDANPLLTPTLKALLTKTQTPIFLLKDAASFTTTIDEPLSMNFTGTLVGQRTLDRLQSSDMQEREGAHHEIIRVLMPTLIRHSAANGFMDPQMKDEGYFARIQNEFNLAVAQFNHGNGASTYIKRKAEDVPYWGIISDMHFLLHSPLNDPAAVRAAMPLSAAAYDRCMEKMTEQARQTDPSIVPVQPSVIAEPPPVPTPPHVDLDAWAKRLPRPFTGMELETQFLKELQPRLVEALSANPPYNQVQVRMVHGVRRSEEAGGNHRVAENYRFVVILRNAERATMKPIELDTGTKDYHVAALLKGAIQSHLLSHPGMQPLYLPGITDKRDRPSSPTETVLPHWELGRVVHVPHEDGTLRARFTFLAPPAEAGGPPREVTTEVSLGLRFDLHNPRLIEEATRRVGWLEQRYKDLMATGQWATLGELVEGLKEHIYQHDSTLPHENRFGWSRRKTLRLYEPKEGNPLEFPSPEASNSQSTTYGCPYIHYDEHQVNPTYVAYIPIAVKNGDALPIKHRLRINLHTADETTALVQTAEALDKLKADMKQLAESHPYMYWQEAEHRNASGTGTYKTLDIVDIEGNPPPHPHPMHLEHVQDDLSGFRTGFHVVQREEPKELGNGKLQIVLGINRGEEANGDAMPFRDVDREVFRHTITIDASHRERLPEFLATIEANFEQVLRDTYCTSKEIGGKVQRVRMQDYRPQTIRNCFVTAVGMEVSGEEQDSSEKGKHTARVSARKTSPSGAGAMSGTGWRQAMHQEKGSDTAASRG